MPSVATASTYETMRIAGKDIRVECRDMKQADLQFYAENPRIYSILSQLGPSPSQGDIERMMCDQSHVKELRNSIEANGGLIEPLIVRESDKSVLEGNSRLAAYRMLARKDPIKWGMVRCKILPSTTTDEQLFSLLGQFHIVGRKDWEPYEQASYLYRRHETTRIPVKTMAKELGIGEKDAQRYIDVIQFMKDKGDNTTSHWSTYYEYLKNRQISDARAKEPSLDTIIVSQITAGAITDAKDMRKLGEIAKLANNGVSEAQTVISEIAAGQQTIYNGYDIVKGLATVEEIVKKARQIKTLLASQRFHDGCLLATGSDKEAIALALKQIKASVNSIVSSLN